MYANYHTHTYRCNHATGTPREYVEQAIKNGLTVLGFSDHNPCPFSNGHKSAHRMDTSEAADYVKEILALKEEYKGRLDIYIGYETEYYPKEFKATIEFMTQYPCDYLILGQHFLKNEYDGIYTGACCTEADLTEYVNQVIEGLQTGVFSYLAHPDVVNYRKDADFYEKEMTRLCEAAKQSDIPLEFNQLGFGEGRHYPYKPFWEIAARVGNKVVIGSDAHRAVDVAEPILYQKAVDYLVELGIVPVKEITFRSILKK